MRADLLDGICNYLTGVVGAPTVAVIRPRIANRPDPIGEAFNDHRATMVGWIPVNPEFTNRFTDLINFIGTPYTGLDTPADRAGWLVRFNALFHSTAVHARHVLMGVAPQDVIDLMIALENANVPAQPGFLAYTAAHGANSFARLRETYGAWAADGRARGDLHLLIELLRNNLVPLDKLTATTCLDIRKLAATHPAGGPFRGFGSWGSGNHGGIAANVENHFKKHVLNALDASLADLTECPIWWRLLNIQLAVAQMAAVPASASKFQALALFGGGGVLPFGDVQAFLGHMRTELMRPGSPLTTWLVDNFKVKYKDATLGMSVRMQHAAVFFEIGSIFASGTHNANGGDFYIVGRLDDGVLTISSCYVATDINAKLAAREVLWTFV